MSTTPGKVHILGRNVVDGQEVFTLQYLQCRRPELVRRPFFARFDPAATWFDQLEPASESDAPFFPRFWPGAAFPTASPACSSAPSAFEEAGVRVPLRIAVDET